MVAVLLGILGPKEVYNRMMPGVDMLMGPDWWHKSELGLLKEVGTLKELHRVKMEVGRLVLAALAKVVDIPRGFLRYMGYMLRTGLDMH